MFEKKKDTLNGFLYSDIPIQINTRARRSMDAPLDAT